MYWPILGTMNAGNTFVYLSLSVFCEVLLLTSLRMCTFVRLTGKCALVYNFLKNALNFM